MKNAKKQKTSQKKSAFSGAKPPENIKKIVANAIQQSVALHQQGNISAALEITKQTLARAPNNITLLNNAGAFTAMLGDFEQSKIHLSKSLKIKPQDINTLNNLSNVLAELKQYDQASDIYRQILKLDSNDAVTHSNFANALQKKGSHQEAEKHYLIAIQLDPNNVVTCSNLGALYKEQKNISKAKEFYQKALKLNPNFAEAHNNFGLLLKEVKQFSDAETCYQNALNLNPKYSEAHNNLGELFREKKQFEQAKDCYQRALSIDTNYTAVKWNLSLLQLALTNFSEGWKCYETRNHSENTTTSPVFPIVTTIQYQGENLNQDLKNKHLLIIPEQGVGDEVMFASVLPELADVVAQNPNIQITLACDPRLVELFERSFDFVNVIPSEPDNRYQNLDADLDYWMFIGSLPKFYRNDIKDFDKHQPYLKVDDTLLIKWQDRFKQLPHKLNIGISWIGGKTEENRADRSLILEKMFPILTKASQSANIINLQYGDHQQEIQDFKQKTGIITHDWEDADPLKDLDNFAAQIKALDLVISIDNSTVHFAGALGTKTYVMLPFNQDWRWAEDRNDSYWYPNIMTLFRQSQDGEWDEVIQNVANSIQ